MGMQTTATPGDCVVVHPGTRQVDIVQVLAIMHSGALWIWRGPPDFGRGSVPAAVLAFYFERLFNSPVSMARIIPDQLRRCLETACVLDGGVKVVALRVHVDFSAHANTRENAQHKQHVMSSRSSQHRV